MIAQRTIQKITREIVKACDPQLVILFGSYGRGKQNEESDLDIFVVTELEGSAPEKVRCLNRFITSRGFGIDIVVRTPEQVKKARSGRDWFVQEIARDGKCCMHDDAIPWVEKAEGDYEGAVLLSKKRLKKTAHLTCFACQQYAENI
ncbi:MAG: nucleotidyltransferase domain-containing protein [Bacteroidetes bacterium]|nr:MAG: nucleotidyltransferase domain-containing protein [Bacteroidota bacterium]